MEEKKRFDAGRLTEIVSCLLVCVFVVLVSMYVMQMKAFTASAKEEVDSMIENIVGSKVLSETLPLEAEQDEDGIVYKDPSKEETVNIEYSKDRFIYDKAVIKCPNDLYAVLPIAQEEQLLIEQTATNQVLFGNDVRIGIEQIARKPQNRVSIIREEENGAIHLVAEYGIQDGIVAYVTRDTSEEELADAMDEVLGYISKIQLTEHVKYMLQNTALSESCVKDAILTNLFVKSDMEGKTVIITKSDLTLPMYGFSELGKGSGWTAYASGLKNEENGLGLYLIELEDIVLQVLAETDEDVMMVFA